MKEVFILTKENKYFDGDDTCGKSVWSENSNEAKLLNIRDAQYNKSVYASDGEIVFAYDAPWTIYPTMTFSLGLNKKKRLKETIRSVRYWILNSFDAELTKDLIDSILEDVDKMSPKQSLKAITLVRDIRKLHIWNSDENYDDSIYDTEEWITDLRDRLVEWCIICASYQLNKRRN